MKKIWRWLFPREEPKARTLEEAIVIPKSTVRYSRDTIAPVERD